MGLDISAHSKTASNFLGPAEQFSEEQQDRLHEEGAIYVSAAKSFEDRLDGYTPGFYRITGKSIGFRAGSYSGYNWWRRHLCRMALKFDPEDVWCEPDVFEGQPFVELIAFSDCEGCIGPKTSKKLAEDFRTHLAQAEAYLLANAPGNPNKDAQPSDDDVHPWWLENYREWLAAFELAADDGFAHFH